MLRLACSVKLNAVPYSSVLSAFFFSVHQHLFYLLSTVRPTRDERKCCKYVEGKKEGGFRRRSWGGGALSSPSFLRCESPGAPTESLPASLGYKHNVFFLFFCFPLISPTVGRNDHEGFRNPVRFHAGDVRDVTGRPQSAPALCGRLGNVPFISPPKKTHFTVRRFGVL